MKKAFSRSIFGKFIIALMVILMLGSLQPTRVEADIVDIAGSLAEPIISFIVALGDGAVHVIHKFIMGQDVAKYYVGKETSVWGVIAKVVAVVAAVVVVVATLGAGAFIGAIGAAVFEALGTAGIIAGAISGAISVVGLALSLGGYVGLAVYDSDFFGENICIPVYTISPEEIFKGEIGLFDVNFFTDKKETKDAKFQNALGVNQYAQKIVNNEDAKVDGTKESYGYSEGKSTKITDGDKTIEYWTNGDKTYFQVSYKLKEGGAVDSPAGDARAVSNMYKDTKIYAADTKEVQKEAEKNKSIAQILKPTVAMWYRILRNIALVAMLSILVYIGIRIVLSTTAENKAKYKQFLVDWAVGLCLLFVMHYGMAFLNLFIDKLTSSLSSITTQVYSQAIKAGDNWDDIKRGLNEIQDEQGGFSWTEIDSADQLGKSGATVEVLKVGKGDDNKYLYVQTNLMGEIRMGTQYAKNQSEGFIGWTVMFIMMVIFLVIFIWMYLKRVMYMAFLTLMAPFVAVTYPLDKIKDGKAQGFDYWFKEYFYNLLLQPLHLLIYTVLVGTATEVAIENPIYGIAALAFLLPAEKILKQMFGFKGETSSGLSQFAGHAMGYNLLQKAFGGLGPGKSSNKAIDSGDSGSVGNSNGSGQGSKINWNKAPGSSQSSSGGQGGGGSSRATIAGVIANKVKPQNTAKRQLKGKRGTPFKLQSAGKKLSGAKPGFFNNLANGSRDVSKAFGRLKGRAGNSKLGRKVSALGQTRGGRAFSAVGRTMGSSAKRKLKNGFKKIKPTRLLARGAGAVALGTLGLAAGAATGDLNKALAFTAGGAKLGSSAGAGIQDRVKDFFGYEQAKQNAIDAALTEDEIKARDAGKYVRSDKYKEEFNKLDSDERRSLRQQASDSSRRLNDLMVEKGVKDLDDQRAMVRALQDSPEFREDMSEQELKSLIEEKNEARKVGNDYLGGKDFDKLDYAEKQRVVDVASYHMDQAAYEKEEEELQQLQEQKETIQNNQALSDQQKKAELAKVQQGKDNVHARRTVRATPVINESSNFNQHKEDVKKGKSYISHKNTLNKKR